MAKARRTPRAGDLLQVRSGEAVAYIQIIGRHPDYGIAIYVYPRFFQEPLADFQELVQVTGYCTFYPAQPAINEGLAEIVASCPPPARVDMPRVWRRPGARAPNGDILTWVIESDDGREVLRETLTDEQQTLPIAAIWNHALLVERLSNQWRPEREG